MGDASDMEQDGDVISSDEPDAAQPDAPSTEEMDSDPGPESDDGATVIAASGNLVTNGGFEQGSSTTPYYWTRRVNSTGSVKRTTGARYSGSYGLRVTSAAGLSPYAFAASMTIDVVPGRSYRVSAMTRKRSGDGQVLKMIFLGSSGTRVSELKPFVGESTKWHQVTGTKVAPSTAVQAVIVIGDDGSQYYNSSYDWDNVRLIAN